MQTYRAIMREAQAIVRDRCAKGRNDFLPFQQRFIHGSGDKVQEVLERTLRIIGAYQRQEWGSARADAIDLVNEAALLVVLMDSERRGPKGRQ